MDEAITELITSYNELNSASIIELDQEPSPLEFMRFVAKNTPFVVRGGAKDWKAVRTWSVDHLKETLANEQVNVAVTPFGYVVSLFRYESTNSHPPATPTPPPPTPPTPPPSSSPNPTKNSSPSPTSSTTSSTKNTTRTPAPLKFDTPRPVRPPSPPPSPPLITLTENNNLPHEYPLLAPSVPPSIPFAHIALSPTNPTSSSPPPLPDATNLWIGNSRSTTALHRDAYENIYVQIRGRKTFVLLPPACQPCVNETGLKGGTYRRSGDGGLELVLDGDGDGGEVPFAPVWDPDRPGERGTRWSGLARGVRVVLGEGDMLYLPCLW